MTAADSKVGCRFKDGKFVISRKNQNGTRSDIYEGQQINRLFFLDVAFIFPTLQPIETALFVKVTETMDLWHH
jgi:hypothetical protein